MTTVYKYKKCNVFGFTKSLKNLCNTKYNHDLYIFTDEPKGKQTKASDINIDNDDIDDDEYKELKKLKEEYETYENVMKDKSVKVFNYIHPKEIHEEQTTNDDQDEENEDVLESEQDAEADKQNIKNIELISAIKSECPTVVIDLSSGWMSDIKIATEKDNKEGETNANYKHDDQTLNKTMTGQTTQLEAFSKNIYTVIYGKKTAGIPQGSNNTLTFNHNVIDSLAKNGVIVDINVKKELKIHKFIRELEKLRKFNVFFIHPYLELEFTEFESPSEISNPIYKKGSGEICAIAYRALILRFFPYLTIMTESMREDAYMF